MALLLLLGVAILFVWLLIRAARADDEPRELDDKRGHELVDALYRDGIRLGYRRAWAHQLSAEEHRVRAFVRRRTLTMTSAAAGALATAAVPLGAALNVLPRQAAWLPAWPQWLWLLLALACLAVFFGLGAFLMPRDYRRFSGTRQVTNAELGRLNEELDALVQGEASHNLNAMKSYVSAMAQERFAAGVRHAQGQGTAAIQTRISSAANAAYVQGRADGATEARAQVSQLTTEAYLRGVGDGERTAATKLEARIRSEREAAYQSGYRVGVSEGRASAGRSNQANTGQNSGQGASRTGTARPRTRADALAIFELTESATADDVRKRYRELQTALHPDVLKGRKATKAMIKFAEEQFKLVGEAYEILQR